MMKQISYPVGFTFGSYRYSSMVEIILSILKTWNHVAT